MASASAAPVERSDSSGYTPRFRNTTGWVGKAVVVSLATIGSVLGTVPAVLLLGKVWWLLILGPIAAAFAVAAVWRLESIGGAPVSIVEILMAAIAAIGPAASYTFYVILFYWMVYGLVQLGGWIARAFGWHIAPDGAGPAHVVSMVIAVIMFPIAVVLTSRGLFRQLSPTAAGLRTPYYRLLVERPWLLLVSVIGAVLALVLLVTVVGADARLFYLWLDLYLVYTTVLLWQTAERGSRPHRPNQVEHAIKKLLEALGLEVIAQPRTGQPEVDPFLLKVDFLALRPGGALLIAIKVRTGEQDPVPWTEGSTLISAAWALSDAQEVLQLGTEHVEPVLVLVGKGPSDALRQFADTEPIGIVHIGEVADLDPALVSDDPVVLERIARSLLGPLVTHRPVNADRTVWGSHAPA